MHENVWKSKEKKGLKQIDSYIFLHVLFQPKHWYTHVRRWYIYRNLNTTARLCIVLVVVVLVVIVIIVIVVLIVMIVIIVIVVVLYKYIRRLLRDDSIRNNRHPKQSIT